MWGGRPQASHWTQRSRRQRRTGSLWILPLRPAGITGSLKETQEKPLGPKDSPAPPARSPPEEAPPLNTQVANTRWKHLSSSLPDSGTLLCHPPLPQLLCSWVWVPSGDLSLLLSPRWPAPDILPPLLRNTRPKHPWACQWGQAGFSKGTKSKPCL